MKFFDIGKNIASLYYKATKPKHKLKIFGLLSYMQTSENNSRYLSDVKHPARKLKNNEELQKLQAEAAEEEENGGEVKVRPMSAATNRSNNERDSSSSKSSTCSNKISEMCLSELIQTRKENEFEQMVLWITLAEQKIQQIMQSNASNSRYSNVRFAPIISSILYLLDAQILAREHQLMGIKLLRKIVEIENQDSVKPAADWDSEDWVQYQRMISLK